MPQWAWVNILPAIAFTLAVVGIPLWITFRYPDVGPDQTDAREYKARVRAAERAGSEDDATLSPADLAYLYQHAVGPRPAGGGPPRGHRGASLRESWSRRLLALVRCRGRGEPESSRYPGVYGRLPGALPSANVRRARWQVDAHAGRSVI